MTVALAARMTIWTLIILASMLGVALAAGFRLRDVTDDYPPVNEALDSYSESDDAQDFEEGTEPPRAA